MPTLPFQAHWRPSALRLSWALCSGLLVTSLLACESARDTQLAALSSPEGPVRAQAISELGKKGDGDNLGDIVAHVGDPDVLVRSSVAAALGNYDERKASDALGELAADSSEPVQVLAARALARQKNPRARSYQLLAYRRDGSAVRAAIVEGLEKSGGSASDAVRAEAKAFWDQLSASLTKGGAAERAGAAEELGRSGRPEAVERLVPYLGADSRALAQAAALGLGESTLSQAREPLEAMLNEQDPDLQMAALQGLETLDSPASAPALVKLALKGGQVGRAALEVLAKLPGEAASLCAVTLADEAEISGRAGELALAQQQHCDQAPLFAKLSHGATAQAAALAALAGLGADSKASADPQRIVSLIRSGSAEVRPLAARAAGALHLEAAAADLRKAMDEAKGRLQIGRERWVKDALPLRFAPGYEPASAIGGQYKEHEEKLMAKLAAQGAHVDETGVGAVGPLFSDDTAADAALFAESARAAVALGASDSSDLVKSLAQDPSPEVRQVACRAAVLLPPSEAWVALKGLSGDPDPAVRSQALELLPELLAKATPADREAAEAVLADALAHTDGTVDDLLIADIGKLGGAQATPAVLSALTGALEHHATANQAARALGELGTPAARAALLDRLRQEASPGLPDIVAALGTLKASEAAPSLRSLLFSVNPSVRAASAQALLAMGDAQGKQDLLALREDYYATVRRAAGAPPATAAPTTPAVPAAPTGAAAE